MSVALLSQRLQRAAAPILAGAAILGASAAASAAVIPCPTTTTLDVLVGFNSPANGCFSQDVLFWGFNYTPAGNATTASGVSANLVFQNGGVNVHGWNFSDSWSQSGSSLANFTLGFSIEVCPSGQPCTGNVAPGTVIDAADAIYAPVSVFPPGKADIDWSNGATVTITNVSPGPLPSNGNIGLGAGTVGPITVAETFSGTGAITQTSLRFYTNNAPIPEPTTLGLLGMGLIGFGGLARLRRV